MYRLIVAGYDGDLLVVGNKHVNGIGRVLGSVAQTVMQNAPCDVLVVNTAPGDGTSELSEGAHRG